MTETKAAPLKAKPKTAPAAASPAQGPTTATALPEVLGNQTTQQWLSAASGGTGDGAPPNVRPPLTTAVASPGVGNQQAQHAGPLSQLANYLASSRVGRVPSSASRQPIERVTQTSLSTARVHQEPQTASLLSPFKTPALSVGRDIVMSPCLAGAQRDEVLGHELAHVSQSQANSSADLRLGARASPAEQQAQAIARAAGGGGAPQRLPPLRESPGLVRRYEPGEGGSSSADWSFDPNAENFETLSNQDLILRVLATREWLNAHAIVELDYSAYLILRDRLDAEQGRRVDLGHLWLDEIRQGETAVLYRLMNGLNGAIDVVAVDNPELINGAPQDLAGQPIMTVQQFQAYLAANGITEIPVSEFLADSGVSATSYSASEGLARGISGGEEPLFSEPGPLFTPADGDFANSSYFYSPDMMLDPALFDPASAGVPGVSGVPGAPGTTGMSGAMPMSSVRDSLLVDAFSLRNINARQGSLAEVYFGTSRRSGYGFGVTDYNARPWTHPTRGVEIGNHPLADYSALLGDTTDFSVKSRRATASADPFSRFGTYLHGHSDMLDTSPGYRGFTHYMNNAANGRTPAEVRADMRLVVNVDDLPAYQAFLSDPFHHETTPSGGTSAQPNYRRAAMRRIYDGILQDHPITPGDGGAPLRSVADVDAALDAGRLSAAEHAAHLRRIGGMAADQVEPNPELTTARLGDFELARAAADPRYSAADVRRLASPEYLHSISHGGGMRGDLHAVRSYGGRAALLSAGMGMAMEGYDMYSDGVDNPDAGRRLLYAGGREGLRGGLSTSLETVAASRTSAYLLRSGFNYGARATLMRGAARFVPGGVVDVGFELYDIANEDREHSAGEVGYRSGRAFVIGGASSLLGTALGSAATAAVAGSVVPGVGTAIGFVVGLAVGIGAALALNYIIPRYDELGGEPSGRSMTDAEIAEFSRRLGAAGMRCPSHHGRSGEPPSMADYDMRPDISSLLLPPNPDDPLAHPSPLRSPFAAPTPTPAEMEAIRAWIEASPSSEEGATGH